MQNVFCQNSDILAAVNELDPYGANNDGKYSPNDLGNGRLFADIFGEVCRFNTTTDKYMVYDGIRWKDDTGNMITDGLAKRLARVMWVYVGQAAVQDELARKNVNSLQKRGTRNTMIQDAQSYNAIAADMLDADGNLLNLQNGTLDLMTGELLPHDPAHLLSKVCNASYDPAAVSDEWTRFVSQVMMDDADKIDYLQRVCGYGLLGSAPEDEFYLFYGSTTRNGKSTLLRTIAHLLGDYAQILPPDELAQRQKSGSVNNDYLANLRGARFVSVSEPSKGMVLDTATVKNLTGKDVFTVSRKFEHPREIDPVFKIYVATNYLPTVTDDTLFTSGRVAVISFDRHFEDDEQDKTLKDRLESPENAPGILNWLLEGLQNYRKRGARRPNAVRAAVSDYAEESDKLGNFIADMLVPVAGQCVSVGHALTIYEQWCLKNHYQVENRKNFQQGLKRKGIYKSTGTINGKTVRHVIVGYLEAAPLGGTPFDSDPEQEVLI